MSSSSLVLAVCIWSIEHFKMQKIQPFGTLKSYYNNMHKIFKESPSRRADYERILCTTKEDYPLFFLLHALGGERKCCQNSSENLAEACSSSEVLVRLG